MSNIESVHPLLSKDAVRGEVRPAKSQTFSSEGRRLLLLVVSEDSNNQLGARPYFYLCLAEVFKGTCEESPVKTNTATQQQEMLPTSEHAL